jgi:hypothetical protein
MLSTATLKLSGALELYPDGYDFTWACRSAVARGRKREQSKTSNFVRGAQRSSALEVVYVSQFQAERR